MVACIHEENDTIEPEPNCEQLLSQNLVIFESPAEERRQREDSEFPKSEEPKPKKARLNDRSHCRGSDNALMPKTLRNLKTDAPQHHEYKEEVLVENCSLDQEDQDDVQIREEEQLVLKHESDSATVALSDEDNNSRENKTVRTKIREQVKLLRKDQLYIKKPRQRRSVTIKKVTVTTETTPPC
ncbi:uncharacterized protein KZ484_025187 [Pholidichthys leucotaenia]